MMPRSFLVKQQEKPQDTEKDPRSSEKDKKALSQNGLGSPPPLLKMSPRHSPLLQRTSISTDNRRPIPRLVKIGDTVPTTKSIKEDYNTRSKLDEQRIINESLNSKLDLRMRHHLSMMALPPKDVWSSHGPESRSSLHSSYVDDYRRPMQYKNAGLDVRQMYNTANSYPREQERFYPHQPNANHIEVAGKPFAASILSRKAGEGTYYAAHGAIIGAKGGVYPNLQLYSNVAFQGAKENETSSQAITLPRYYLPHFYPNFSDHEQNKDFRKPVTHAEVKAREESKASSQEDAMAGRTEVVTSTSDVKLQDSEYNQSGASISNVEETVPNSSVNGEDHAPKAQVSNTKKYRYTCDVCGKSFSRSNTLTTHKRIHTGDKPFHCEQCGRAFRQPGNLTRHRLTHTAVKPYVCPQCNKAFNRASNLHTHMRTHTNYKPFVCDFCGKGFHQKIDMKIHRYTHTGEKPHKCTKCGRGFKQLTHLTYHMRTHSDERLYKCEYCGKGFNQKGNLQAHIYGHTGERPFKCDICDKGFTLASTLNTHKRTHAMKKPFECQFCGKAFYQKNALKTHYIASHPFANGVSLL